MAVTGCTPPASLFWFEKIFVTIYGVLESFLNTNKNAISAILQARQKQRQKRDGQTWDAGVERVCGLFVHGAITRRAHRKLRSAAFVIVPSWSVKPDRNAWNTPATARPVRSVRSPRPAHRRPTVCHTPVACFQCHPLTQPPSHMYGRATGGGPAIHRLTERLLSSFILWRLQHWILGGLSQQWSYSSARTTSIQYI